MPQPPRRSRRAHPRPIRVRMYNVGFGDCFLVVFPATAEQPVRKLLLIAAPSRATPHSRPRRWWRSSSTISSRRALAACLTWMSSSRRIATPTISPDLILSCGRRSSSASSDAMDRVRRGCRSDPVARQARTPCARSIRCLPCRSGKWRIVADACSGRGDQRRSGRNAQAGFRRQSQTPVPRGGDLRLAPDRDPDAARHLGPFAGPVARRRSAQGHGSTSG